MVRLEHIDKNYGLGAPILSDVSLELEPGGFYFLTGASGVGKTTLLNIICLAEQPTRGKMTLFGRDAATLDRTQRAAFRRRIGIVFQDFRLIDNLSAGENVALPLRIKGAPEKQIRENVPELLAWVGLDTRSEAPAHTLSGGEQQRIAIARAVVGRPDLLVADEPTGNVDDDVAMLLVRVFERINRLGTTVLIATHDIAFARQFEHRRFHLERGRVTLAGGGADIIAEADAVDEALAAEVAAGEEVVAADEAVAEVAGDELTNEEAEPIAAEADIAAEPAAGRHRE